MRSAQLLLLLAGCTSATAWDADVAAAAIRSWNRRSEPEPLSRVEAMPFPGQPDFLVAICDYQEDWSGFFGIYHLTDGAVDWEASAEVIPGEQSIYKLRVLNLPGFSRPIIEVFGRTHMGNGSLYLYELREQRLVLLLQTKAVDFNANPLQFHNGCLEPTYRDLDADGSPDLILTGTIEDWGETGDTLLHSHPCRRVFLWNGPLGQFVEDSAREEGFGSSE